MLISHFDTQFKKDMKLMKKRGYDIDAISAIITDIIYENPLPARCRPHKLSGNLAKYTECHALNDVLLLYISSKEKVSFHRIGTHSDLL